MKNDVRFEFEKPELSSYKYFGMFFSAGSAITDPSPCPVVGEVD